MADLFINYRRRDSAWAAGRIGDRLRAQLGEKSVFLDTLGIEPGADFVETIGDHVEECRALMAIIGPDWLEELSARANQPNDFVRVEIAQALKRGVRVIPLILDGVDMPVGEALPEEIAGLSRLNAVRVHSETFEADMAHLVRFLEGFLATDSAVSDLKAEAPAPHKDDRVSGISLRHRTEFWKLGRDGRPRHKIFVSLDAPDDLIEAVEKVVYRLHPTFRNRVREIADPENNFELRTNGWGEFEIGASVHLTNRNAPVELRHMITFDN